MRYDEADHNCPILNTNKAEKVKEPVDTGAPALTGIGFCPIVI
jgi:hypothetical protein